LGDNGGGRKKGGGYQLLAQGGGKKIGTSFVVGGKGRFNTLGGQKEKGKKKKQN